MTKKSSTTQPRKINLCSGCNEAVVVRRPSQSGNHWCSKPGCQALKQKSRRAALRGERLGESPDVQQARFDFFVTVMTRPRKKCGTCGLEDAVPGYIHRKGVSSTPCPGVGSGGARVGLHYLDVVHPGLVPPTTVEDL